ncbi:Bax inhibitor-1/YccA family protein [Fibrella sp. WM1]|uniref:Bax inhibitor-1/YccA family protein n=1 Tax=Fibrella musci TaxID=3242485 RepID=UPI0035213B55
MESQPNQSPFQPTYLSPEAIAREQATFMTQVYGWMTVALLVTASISIWTASSETLLTIIFGNRLVFYGLLLGEVGLVMALSAMINRLTATTATALFLVYAILNGLTLASIFLVFTGGSIASTFFVTAGTFGAMSAYGYFTKSDLTRWGNLLLMALVGLIIASAVNLFMHSETLYWISSFVGVLIFTGLTAYDTQKIKAMNIIGNAGTDEDRKEAIMGALTLYLDFINLFLYLLRFLGNRK